LQVNPETAQQRLKGKRTKINWDAVPLSGLTAVVFAFPTLYQDQPVARKADEQDLDGRRPTWFEAEQSRLAVDAMKRRLENDEGRRKGYDPMLGLRQSVRVSEVHTWPARSATAP
jgi:hypothetical protein